ncbi:sensor domain-containing diguanylate cyclase [uncultured Ilyobacter sp.]|uniref:sensor domain-containing diguanylate cyclase n=1 Tax=uncultured Ilyobacter sp. TaxID=544433 RepID=UPI0029C7AAE4|nr:sensor domain-containing diguanylate cyclase [uncultured Ilyobacter sp.]
MKKFKNKYALIINLILVAGFLSVSLTSYFVSLNSLRKEIRENQLPLTSDNIYSEIQRDFLQPVYTSSLMAMDTFLRDWVISGEKNENKIVKYLKEIKIKYNTFTSFFVSDQTYRYYHTDGVLKKVSKENSRDKWYFRVQNMQNDYEINVDPDMANNDTMTIFVNYKVYDYNGEYIGATGVGLKVDAVKSIIERYQKDYGSRIYFTDSYGNIVLHGSNFKMEPGNIHEIEGLSKISNGILKNRDKTQKYKKNGEFIHVNSRYIPELKWHLVVEKSEGGAIKNIHKALYLNLAICTAIVIMIFIFMNILVSPYEKKLQEMATTDKLTGVYNRQAFDLVMLQTLKDAERNKSRFSIIIFDIDFFKETNDKYGHMAGDEVLKNVASTTKTFLRKSDVFSRWGGDEFILLLKDCGIGDASKLAENIRNEIKKNNTVWKNEYIFSTVSMGVAEYHLHEELDKAINRADKALYASKVRGRDRVEEEQLEENSEVQTEQEIVIT